MIEPEQQTQPQSNAPGGGAPLRRNQKLGKYRLARRVGMGGYCEVWKARDRVEGIWVALKIPQPDTSGKRDNQAMLREVRLVAQLRHPHIMPVKNAEIIDGYAVMATELSVRTLDDCSRPMSFKRIVMIITQVLEGLTYAHSHRMVHCDVTPGNIFLFPNGRVAIGDFGIGLKMHGRMETVDEFGTPGYVAPEQAYGHPTYRSDCFSVGLILYEFITGVLPRWPFTWPYRGHERLRKQTSTEFVRFMKKALAVKPDERFVNAKQMSAAMREAVPRALDASVRPAAVPRTPDWRQLRRETFLKRYRKVLPDMIACTACGEPVSERMHLCPWCGTTRNRFDEQSRFSHVCSRCHKGLSPSWSYCPWCYGVGYIPQPEKNGVVISYHDACRHCGGKVMRFMRYCPWCNRRIRKAWVVFPFPETCAKCGWSVDSDYWNYCPWCTKRLIE
ncbi:MAG: protein kinase [Phycisphaerae bacterium]|nr:protein kinase [Phycisphaerae bacterium]